MRAVVLDTETTGLDPKLGHRIVEIGCLELRNHIPTGQTYHQYINPERDVPPEAFEVHGLSTDFLKGFPPFRDIVHRFIEFIGEAPLIIHNAKFDMRFLNAELNWLNLPPIAEHRAICTLEMAKQKYPGAQASLDALCRRFGIDNSNRIRHGALLDAELLADVYIEMIGGRQTGLNFTFTATESSTPINTAWPTNTYRPPRPHTALEEERRLHNQLLDKLKNPLWRQLAVD
jgi:DNA polymerase-3 subunit epsilon